jgi:DNA-binding PadR family transcriptional regulator
MVLTMSHRPNDDWLLNDLRDLFDFDAWTGRLGFQHGGPRRRRRRQMFESGEVKFVILKLLREKPRHGYEVIKELEERLQGCYSPSAGTVYPTLQMLEDQGYVRAVEQDGKKVYHITPEGEAFLDENTVTVDDIFERVRETLHGYTGGSMGELHRAFGGLAKSVFKRAYRRGPTHPGVAKVADVIRRTTDEVDRIWAEESAG